MLPIVWKAVNRNINPNPNKMTLKKFLSIFAASFVFSLLWKLSISWTQFASLLTSNCYVVKVMTIKIRPNNIIQLFSLLFFSLSLRFFQHSTLKCNFRMKLHSQSSNSNGPNLITSNKYDFCQLTHTDAHMTDRVNNNNVQMLQISFASVHLNSRSKHVPNILPESIVWTPRIN